MGLFGDLSQGRLSHAKLYDLKVINFCPSRYGRMQRAAPEQSGAVNFRAAAVAGEYRRRAQNVDRREAGTSETQIGPVESALNDYGGCTGLSLGHYGEASATVEEFLKWCAAVAAENSWRRLGFTSLKYATGAFLSTYRHRVGLAHARHKSQHLHLNMQHVEGAQGNEHSRTAEQAAVHAGVARSYKAGRPRAFRPPPQGAGRARGGSH